jgi:hypothetical protein
MSRKKIPIETLIVLQNNLDVLAPRDKERIALLKEMSNSYGVSISTLRRALRLHRQPSSIGRSDYNKTRIISKEEMKRYCEIVAAMKLRTTNKKGRHLSTKECIRILEEFGVDTPNGNIKVKEGVLKRTTIDRYVDRWGLSQKSIRIEPYAVSFEASNSNECWQFDFSLSDLKKLKFENKKISGKEPILMLSSVVDDRSGVCYQEYHYILGEDTMTALKFLFNAMSPKTKMRFPFQGIPQMIYLDNGPVRRSKVFNRVMKSLGIELRSHMPKGTDGRRTTARSKGKVERQYRTVKESFETLYHFHKPETLEEANDWLHKYLLKYNDGLHRTRHNSRIEDWKSNLPPEGFRKMCDWKKFCSFAREPEERLVDSQGRVNINGVLYQLNPEMAGSNVDILWGILDNELFVDFNGIEHGPFYPSAGPIPIGTYRKRKKSTSEKIADKIEELSKLISIDKSVMTGGNSQSKNILNNSNIVDCSDNTPFVPFEDNKIDSKNFKNKVEAKSFISTYIGKPLGNISKAHNYQINDLVSQTLDKKLIQNKIKELFSYSRQPSNAR